MDQLSTHNTALTPYNQFHREMRQLLREYQSSSYIKKSEKVGAGEYGSELNRIFRLYLIRELQIPALNRKSREIMLELKRHHKPVFKSVGVEIQRLLREFEKAMESKEKLGMVDCDQFCEMSRGVVEANS